MNAQPQEQQQEFVKWSEGAAILGLERNAFFYLVESGQVASEAGRRPRDGRYSLKDIMTVKEKREQAAPRKPHKVHRRRLAPVVFDWLSPLDIPAILKLDQIVYDQMYLAEAVVYEQWAEKCPRLAMAAFDASSKRQEMLAYVAALPLDESVILQVMRHEREEISITKEEIQSYERTGPYTLLGNSAVTHPDRPDLLFQVLSRMTAFWLDQYPERYVTRIYSQSVSEGGDRMISHFFMSPRYDLAPDAYMLDLARPGASKVIRWFQSRIAEKGPLPIELQHPYIPATTQHKTPIAEKTHTSDVPHKTPLRVSHQQKAPTVRASTEEHSMMPPDMVGAAQFAKQHGFTEHNLSTIQKAIDSGRLATISGSWHVGRAIVKKALDAAGRAQFYQLYCDNQNFQGCLECPHEVR